MYYYYYFRLNSRAVENKLATKQSWKSISRLSPENNASNCTVQPASTTAPACQKYARSVVGKVSSYFCRAQQDWDADKKALKLLKKTKNSARPNTPAGSLVPTFQDQQALLTRCLWSSARIIFVH